MGNRPVTVDDVAEALSFIDPDLPRDEWAMVGMAIKSEFDDNTGFDLFDNWSERGDGYNKDAVRSTWNSIKKGGGVSIGTLFHLAKEEGFEFSKEEVSPEEEARRKAEWKERQRVKAEAARKEEAERQWWYEQVSQLSISVWRECGAREGASPYLTKKKVRNYNVRFVEEPFVLYVDVDNRTTGIVKGWEASQEFLQANKGRERDGFHKQFLKKGALIVPLRDMAGKIWNLQIVYESGAKVFIRNGRKSGLFTVVGALPKEGEPERLGFAEGYATAGSAFEVTRKSQTSIIVTFDAGNLPAVAQQFRGVYPGSHFVVFGDDDWEKEFRGARFRRDQVTPELQSLIDQVERDYPHIPIDISEPGESKKGSFNTGVTKALMTAALTDSAVMFPIFPEKYERVTEGDTDFNDLHVNCGMDYMLAKAFGDEELAFIESRVALLQRLEDARPAPERTLSHGVETPQENNSNNEYIGNSGGDEPPPPEPPENYSDDDDDSWLGLFRCNDKGKPVGSIGNIKLILKNDRRWRGVLGFCSFSYRVLKLKAPPCPHSEAGEWEDADAERLRIWIEQQGDYNFAPKKSDVQGALIVVSQENRFHPVQDYLNRLVWDGEPRIDKWLTHSFQATDPKEYLDIAGARFLIGSVARIMDPGCKMETVLILEGKQGRGKSTVVKLLFGDWFSDGQVPIGDKDAYLAIQGVWGQELAELDSFNKADSTAAKSFFSQMRDRFRPPYGATMQEFKRQTVFIGTTNQDEYLKDYTGNRRYWPVKCLTVEREFVREHRDQLWAEAMFRYKQGEKWWLDEEHLQDLFEEVQDSRRQLDPWEEYILDYVESDDKKDQTFFTTSELLDKAIKKDKGATQRADQNRLSPIMKGLGWEKAKRLINIDDKNTKGWRHGYVRPKGDGEPLLPGDE